MKTGMQTKREINVFRRSSPVKNPSQLSHSTLSAVASVSPACSAQLNKQIGQFTCTAAVDGKKMDHCSENISPGHGSQIGWISDMADAYVTDNLSKAPYLTCATPPSVPEEHTWTLCEEIWISESVGSGRKEADAWQVEQLPWLVWHENL